MKKKLFITAMAIITALCGYAQEFSEGFEDPWLPGSGPNTGPPGGWGIYDNGIGTSIKWVRSTLGNPLQPPHTGSHAAYLGDEPVPAGFAEDWLITPQFTMPENGQIRFFSRVTTAINEGNIYGVRISTAATQGDLAAYTVLQSLTEPQLNPVPNIYLEKVVDIPAEYYGQQVYVALVMQNDDGDRWLVDDFSVLQICDAPTNVVIPEEDITLNSAEISWTDTGAPLQWEIEIVPVNEPFTGTGNITTTGSPYLAQGLDDSTTYKVRIRAYCDPGVPGVWSQPQTFTTVYTAPDNDDCDNATTVPVNPTLLCDATVTGTLIAATSSSQSNTCTGIADDDVWFEFTAENTSHIIQLNTLSGSTDNLVHAVYENTCGSLVLRYCSDNNQSNAINLTVGSTYKIRVYSNSGEPQTSTFSVCIATPPPPPANDECAGAVTVPINVAENCILTAPGTLYSATASPQANSCGGNDDDDVWFEFTATSTAHLISLINITGGTPDLFHVVYQGDNCGALTQLYCSNPNNSMATGLTVGETYKIRIYSFTGTPGQTTSFDVCVATPPPPPANDNCDTATALTVNPTLECTAVTNGTVYAATPSAEPNSCTGNDDDDVWFEFTATSDSHTINITNIAGSTSNLVHAVYQGNDCGALNQLYCSDPNNSTATGLTAGETYKVRIYTFTSVSGQDTSFSICVGTVPDPPVNDDCAAATNVPVNATDACAETVPGTLLAATASAEPNTCTGSDDDDVWYRFTATNNTHTIKLENIQGSTTDLFHAVYSGNECGTLTQLYCSDLNSSLATGLTPGQVYKIRVYSVTATTGQNTTFTVCVATPPPPPANDECENATVVPVNQGNECTETIAGTIYSATPSALAATCSGTPDDDVWFAFTATKTNHDISLQNITGSTNSLVMAVYSGADCNALSGIYCTNNNSINASFLTPGETYYIRVYTFTDAIGQNTSFEICVSTPQQPIFTDDTTYTVPQLIEEVLVSTACAQVNNLSWKTGNTDGFNSANGIAYFTKGDSDFPIEEGIVLSTGSAIDARGPNTSELSEGNEAWTGDEDLFNYIQALGIDAELEDYNNATVIEFDFVPLTDNISFPFIFASEEYGTYQCTFSDAFAFFLTNTETGQTTNLAVLPGTDVPISVVTIRDDANDECDAVNEEYYAQNNEGANAISADINYNGQTIMLTAQSAVTVNTVYHIKLVIADRNDELLDSAVFIGPFDIGAMDLGEDRLVASLNALCEGESYTIDSELDPALYTIKWFKDDVEITGETGPAITVNEPGTYSIEALYLSSTCTATESIVIEYYEPVADVTGNPANLTLCNTNGTAVFDLSQNNSVITEGLNVDDYTIVYYETLSDAENQVNSIGLTYESNTATQELYVRINNNVTGCHAIKSFTVSALTINPGLVVEDFCDGNSYKLGITATDGSFVVEDAQYNWSGPDGFSATESEIEITTPGEYIVIVTTAEGCTLTASATVGENPCLIPRGISPNGDGLNDSFDLSGVGVKKLVLFNRYGLVVYEKENYTDEWNGQDENGSELPTGTYFYSLTLERGPAVTGWVYLNRAE